MSLALALSEELLSYESDDLCPECRTKRKSGSDCPVCQLRVEKCTCGKNAYVAWLGKCIACGNTYLP